MALIQEKLPPVVHRTGETWRDVDGEPIQAHGGGILVHEGVYYWYGENRAGAVRTNANGKPRAEAVGVSCYRSADLMRWQNLGVVLPAVADDPDHDLHISRVIERPKVIYNRGTGRFVMWLHVDSPDYKAARAGVAVADDPAGPFVYLQSYRPNGGESRDQTVFQDEDGTAYHIGASDMNQNTLISQLSEDYLTPTSNCVKAFPGGSMEAFAFCKRDGRHWMIASGCTGWKPNSARSAVADRFIGPWEEMGNPCVGPGSNLTFQGQSTFILPLAGADQPYVAMFDIWRPQDLKTSGYMWLPIEWRDGRMEIKFRETWKTPS
jgi:hypothetical protein